MFKNRFFYGRHIALLTLGLLIILGLAVNVIASRRTAKTAEMWHWRGVIPGTTTEEQVIAMLGKPDEIIRCDEWGSGLENPDDIAGYRLKPCLLAPVMYEYQEFVSADTAPGRHQIHFREGRVWLVVEDLWAYPSSQGIPNEKVIAKYGWPKMEGWARGPSVRHLLYCEQGSIVAINDLEALDIFHFAPMLPSTCLQEFKFYLTSDPPGMIIN